jgi:DHA2 family multidrug resistance protein
MLDRRAQVHQNFLASHLNSSNPALQARLKALGLLMQAHGGGPPGSSPAPWAFIQAVLQRQAAMLAYVDCFALLGVCILVMIPAVFLMKNARAGAIAVH